MVPEITDVDDPQYENSNNVDTNVEFVNLQTSDSVHNCVICNKKIVNYNVFAKHVLWHATSNAADVAARLVPVEDDSSELDIVFEEVQNDLLAPLSSTTNTPQSEEVYKSFVASASWCTKFVKRNNLKIKDVRLVNILSM